MKTELTTHTCPICLFDHEVEGPLTHDGLVDADPVVCPRCQDTGIVTVCAWCPDDVITTVFEELNDETETVGIESDLIPTKLLRENHEMPYLAGPLNRLYTTRWAGPKATPESEVTLHRLVSTGKTRSRISGAEGKSCSKRMSPLFAVSTRFTASSTEPPPDAIR